jgi:hypothetical protein
MEWNQARPRLIIIDEEPASWKGGGAFFLDWREDGKRKRKQVGKAPREALDAWRKATGVANGSIPDDSSKTTDGITDRAGTANSDRELSGGSVFPQPRMAAIRLVFPIQHRAKYPRKQKTTAISLKKELQ